MQKNFGEEQLKGPEEAQPEQGQGALMFTGGPDPDRPRARELFL